MLRMSLRAAIRPMTIDAVCLRTRRRSRSSARGETSASLRLNQDAVVPDARYKFGPRDGTSLCVLAGGGGRRSLEHQRRAPAVDERDAIHASAGRVAAS